MEDTIFVTIGYTNSNIPLMNKVAQNYIEGESIVKIAKDLRNRAAKEINLNKPSFLTWAVFDNVNDFKPVSVSENWNPHTMVGCEKFIK
jgi:hypothetical protein